jgi:outer membrane biosynthesis protein TonB
MGSPYGAQQQYQQPPQQYQQQYQQPPQQQYQQPYQQQQQYQQPPPVTMAPVEEEKKSNVGLIIGIIGGVIAVLALTAFFVLGSDFFGGKKDGDTADAKGDDGKAAAVGGLSLELTPADAVVKIDGKEYPGSSPRAIAELSPGKHTIEVSGGDLYLPLTQEVEVAAGDPVALPLKLQLRDVTLDITVDPPSASVSLVAGTTATAIGAGVATHKHALKREPGVEYSIKGTAEGFTETTVPIVFSGDATQAISITLAKSGAVAPPPDPTPTPDPTPDPVPEADKPDPVKKTTKKHTQPAKPKNAELKIGVAPGNPPADVWVDGKKADKKTPVFVKVSEGSHKVKWKWDDGKTDEQSVSVAANESKLLKGSK